MKTDTKTLDKCQVELTVSLEADEMKAVVKTVEKTFLREAQIPGFRKGKVPIELIRKEFAGQLKQEIEREMFKTHYDDAVKTAAIADMIGLVGVKDIAHDENGGSFVAIVEVKPTFKLPTYKGIKVSSKDTKVDDATVQEQVNRMRVAFSSYEDAKEGDAVAEGDFIQIDYSGMIGKKSILEINPEAKIVAEGKGFWTQLEEGRFLPEILDAVKTLKVGETKEGVKAKFDKESAPDGLKGEKAVYTVKLVAARHRVLPSDEEFVKKAQKESLEKIVADVRDSLEKTATAQEAARRESEVIDLLLKKADFDVPETQVRRAMDNYLNELGQRAQYSGLDASYFEKNRDKILKDAEEAATKQVRLWYILEGIVKAEKIEAKDDEVGKKALEFILANAKQK